MDDPKPQSPQDQWLARLAMSFFIVGVALYWTAYRDSQTGRPAWRITVYVVAATLSVGLGIVGTKAKHRGR